MFRQTMNMIRQTLIAEKTKIITPANVFVGTYAAVGLTVVVAVFLMAYSTGHAALSLLTVNQTYGSENEMKVDLFDLGKYEKKIYRFSLNASVNLKTDDALVRFVLVGKNNKEYLVYETDSAISGQTSFPTTIAVTDSNCEETCVLPGIQVNSLKIQTKNASVVIGGINYLDRADATKSFQANSRTEIVNRKIASINAKNLSWKAGHTSVSDLSYADKKKLFVKSDGTPVDELPDLQGFEYYKGGIFVMSGGVSPEKSATPSSNIVVPEYFDWRKVHGENWLTSVKNQGKAGTCWAHAQIGALESQINLYYNQPLNLNLSEQALVDMFPSWSERYFKSCHSFWHNNLTYCVIRQEGIADENCDIYAERDDDILDYSPFVCSDFSNRSWKNNGFNSIIFRASANYTNYQNYLNISFSAYGFADDTSNDIIINGVDNLKKQLIIKGPLAGGINTIGHAMVLIGYGTISKNDSIFILNPNNPSVSSLVGQTYWLFKNSWGTSWGENGYGRFFVPIDDFAGIGVPLGLFTPPADHSYWPSGFDGEVKCVDKDGDNYCNWGISDQPPMPKPPLLSACPQTCKKNSAGLLIKDCNDADAKLGPFISENNFNCASNLISTIYSVKDSQSCSANAGVELGRLNTSGLVYKLCKTPNDLPVSMAADAAACPAAQPDIAGVFQAPDKSNLKLCYDGSNLLVRAVKNAGQCQAGEYNVGVFKGRDGIGNWRVCYKKYASRIVPN